ncbi:MAG: SDR family oxidoreductase [Chitinophagaceae bacterium]
MSVALITGASKGIGKAIAEELAKRKIDVLLVARSGDLLKELTFSLSVTYSVNADYLVTDLTEPDAAKKIFAWCKEKNYRVNMLINNAGYGLSGNFENYPLQDHLDVMTVNMTVTVELCYLFLPSLIYQPQSYILNIASQAAFQAVPGLNVYSASKAFLRSFSRALRYELRKTNVSVTVIYPGSTDTDFARRANVGPAAQKAAKRLNMPAGKVASIAINAMFARKAETTAGIINKIGKFFVWLLPKKWSEKTAGSIYGV